MARPSGAVSGMVQSGSISGAPRGSWSGSAVEDPIPFDQKWRIVPSRRGPAALLLRGDRPRDPGGSYPTCYTENCRFRSPALASGEQIRAVTAWFAVRSRSKLAYGDSRCGPSRRWMGIAASPGFSRRHLMQSAGRKLAFVLASSNHGTMIVNRFDYRMIDSQRGYGVGFQILETAAFDPMEVKLAVELLSFRRRHYGDGVVAIDCGANIGVHTIEWASAMTGWGSVLAIEAQERVYYALAGNIAINNCFNAVAVHGAVSSESGVLQIPNPNYLTASSFGSLELRQRDGNEFIGQKIDYSDEAMSPVRCLTLDTLGLNRVDLLKIDVEGMEVET